MDPIRLSDQVVDKDVCLAQADMMQYETIVHALPGALIVIDANGYVKFFNQRAEELLGVNLKSKCWLDVLQTAFKPQHDDGHDMSLANGNRVSITTTALEDPAGQLLLLTDQTETRAFQDQVNREHRLLAIGKMASSIAHQIRTPVTSATLYVANLMNQLDSDAQYKNYADKIAMQLKSINSYIDDMLLFVNGGACALKPVRLSEVIDATVARFDALVASERLTLNIDLICRDQELLCNLKAISNVFENIIMNAIEACTGPANVNVIISEDRNIINIGFYDDGPGFNATVMDRVSEPFYTTKSQGTGLGLAIVKSVIEAHHGQMKIYQGFNDGLRISLSMNKFLK